VAIATKLLNDHTKPWVRTLQAMSSQGTNGANVDDNHFMGELERTGNITGVENVAKEVSRFVGSFIFKKVKLVNKNDLKTMNSLSRKMRRNLNYGTEEWPAIWTSISMPAIIHQVSKRRSTATQNVKKGLISGKHE
jgi:hypothetical protein